MISHAGSGQTLLLALRHEALATSGRGRAISKRALACLLLRPTWTVDIIDRTQRGELPVQHIAERLGFVAGNDALAGGELAFDPLKEIGRLETLRRFGAGAILLHRDDVPGQMRVNGDFQERFAREVIYRLHSQPPE